MGAPKKQTKAKRNLFTLSLEAQTLLDSQPKTQKSKTVSAAIVQYFNPIKK